MSTSTRIEAYTLMKSKYLSLVDHSLLSQKQEETSKGDQGYLSRLKNCFIVEPELERFAERFAEVDG